MNSVGDVGMAILLWMFAIASGAFGVFLVFFAEPPAILEGMFDIGIALLAAFFAAIIGRHG